MTIAAGTRLGPYEITAQIGAGGMGEVYRARDTRLSRHVALKVLPEAFALDADRLARFTREAQVLASLNHPNIGAIYGFEEGAVVGAGFSRPVQALVLELVEGPTLADRIAEGPIPVEEALPIAHQIAEALEAAHEHGVVHRDLKPSNIKVTPDGNVKVLDFGLAKALSPDVGAGFSGPDMTASPTITSPAMMTGMGVILGTAAYMAPEQAKGRPADKRADVWAFGCVLYEMLTGRAPFAGEDVSDTLANVLKREPDWSALPGDVPFTIRVLLKRCLEKDRRRRISDIAAALFAIDEAANLGAAGELMAVRRPSLLRRVAVAVAALAVGGALAAAAVLYFRAAPAEAPEMRLQIVTPPPGGGNVASFAISPDGQTLAFRAVTEQTTQLWIRTLDSETARPLAGTEDATRPFWSPDGRSIGFFADQKLKRVDVEGGTVQTLADAINASGGTWSPGGVIVLSGSNSPLYRIPAAGGQQPTEASQLQNGETGHRLPHFMPDGRRFLFFATGPPEVEGVFVGSLDSMDTKRLMDAETRALFLPPDWMLFGREDVLYAQRLDLDALTPLGEPLVVADRVAREIGTFTGVVAATASMSGTIAYRPTSDADARELVWMDRQGRQTGTLGSIAGLTGFLRISPDGRTVAVNRTVNRNRDIWLIEVGRGIIRRFTFGDSNEDSPVWSPDGTRIAFETSRRGGGLNDLYQKSLSGSAEEAVVESPENKLLRDWSPDDRFLLYASLNPRTGSDIWAVPVDGDRKPFPVVQTNFNENWPRVSPDGRWIAYESNETGRNEVYVQPFPAPGRNWQISTNGGRLPQWRGDGREIFYLAADSRLMAAPVTLDAKGTTVVDAGIPVPLFPVRPGLAPNYAALPDGQQFLINAPTDDATASPITVVLNWKPRAR